MRLVAKSQGICIEANYSANTTDMNALTFFIGIIPLPITAKIKRYISRFYYDEQFNKVYERWINSGKEKYKKPSLDHITPKAKGGTNDIENLQFLSWFENRCKNDMAQTEWDNLKLKIQEYFV